MSFFFCVSQTLKGVGGDLIILEEAAACEQKMVKEVVVPLLVVDTAVLICISTLKEADNSYSKMFEATKPDGSKMFEQMQVCKQVVLLTLQLCSDLLFVCDRSTWFVMLVRRVTSLRIARTSSARCPVGCRLRRWRRSRRCLKSACFFPPPVGIEPTATGCLH